MRQRTRLETLDRPGNPWRDVKSEVRVIKSELVERRSVQNPHLYRRDADKIINAVFAEITAAMARGDRVELRGFGSFL